MNLTVEPIIKDKKIQNNPSSYNPSNRVKERFKDILADFQLAETIRNNSYEEFGGGSEGDTMDLISYQNKMQKRFNLNIPSGSSDPNQAWRITTIRPIIRNKVISIVAHLTGTVLYPTVVAQNDDSEEDKGMSQVMMDCIEWACEQSKYEDMFLSAVIELCVNPAVILYQDFAEVKRNIKEITSDGKWEMKEIVDEIYSGFINALIPCDELFIANIYERSIQKQPFLIRRKVIDFNEAKAKYGALPDFKYVEPGLRIFFNADNDLFYEDYDDQLNERMVEEVIYYNRNADLELRIINGVMVDDPDRPLQRQDKFYPFAKSFYEEFNSRFFYGMPLVAKMLPDDSTISTLWDVIVNGTIFNTFSPQAIFGSESVDSSVLVPGSTTAFKDPNTKIQSLGNNANMMAAMNTLQNAENSLSQSSQDPLQSGQQQSGDKTKYEVVRLEQNARTVLGLTGKMIGGLVRDFGQLLIGSIVQYMPIAEVGEIVGDDVRLKFPTILLPNKNIDGKKKNRQIEFTDQMPQSEEEQKKMEFDLLKREGYNPSQEDDGDKSIVKVNPDAFRRMKYLVKIEPDFTDRATKFYKKIQLYDRLIMNPLANQEASLRDFLLNPFVPGEEDKYVAKKSDMEQNPVLQQMMNTNKPKIPSEVINQEQI